MAAAGAGRRRRSRTSATPTSSPMDGAHALIFRASVAGRELEGIDLLRFDEDGLIADFTVMLRPLSGLVPFAQAMGEKAAPRARDDAQLTLRRSRRCAAGSVRSMRAARSASGCSGSAPTSASGARTCRRAVDALPGAGVAVLACSSTYDTDPVGEVLDQPSFLNACVRVQTALEPLELLDAVKRLERELGRGPTASATARARSTSTSCCSASSSCARAHDAAARAAARPPLRADPGARARLRAAHRPTAGGWPTRCRRCRSRRACAGPGPRCGPRHSRARDAARGRTPALGGGSGGVRAAAVTLASASSVALLTPCPATTHRWPSRSHVTTLPPLVR